MVNAVEIQTNPGTVSTNASSDCELAVSNNDQANLEKSSYYFRRNRLNLLFEKAATFPLVIVNAGAGWGKTSAVRDFIEYSGVNTIWVQLSERDNVGNRFWENIIHSVAPINPHFAQLMIMMGFPDTDDKISQFFRVYREYVEPMRRILVFDDFHLIEDPDVLRFVDRGINELAPGTSLFLLSRTIPPLNLASFELAEQLVYISENDLSFTDHEINQYYSYLGLDASTDNLRSIMSDTGGWVFAINLIARSYSKAPGYEGYLRNAMRSNIFQLMDVEIWQNISNPLKNFLVRLSLIEHLSVELIGKLAHEDKELLSELNRQSAYVRLDGFISAYLIHHLFLEFLSTKQDLLSSEDIDETYSTAATWCEANGFKVDALSFYEKVGDYQSIVDIIHELPTQIPHDIARMAAPIFERAPDNVIDNVVYFAAMHVRTAMCLGNWEEAHELLEKYESRFLTYPANSTFRNQSLGSLYYCWGTLRTLMSTIDGVYDFDIYYEKMDECFSNSPFDPGIIVDHQAGPWISLVGSSQAGAPQEFIDAFARSITYVSHAMNGAMTGLDDLAQGELAFYQADMTTAEEYVVRGLVRAREQKQFDTVHRALHYLLRIATWHGNYQKSEAILEQMQGLLNEDEYSTRYITSDIALSWYFCILGMPEEVPDWLTKRFSDYGHAYFIENFGNQAKARYLYSIEDYAPLLAYIEQMKLRESILYGRVEMLVLEACTYYRLKNREKAFHALHEAWAEAAPNSIIAPFIILGKDMRSLTTAALKDDHCGIPKQWLEDINRKSASYAKRKSHIIAEYRKSHNLQIDFELSRREMEILSDLSQGLSRSEIAAIRNLSVNTVKMVISNIYSKMGAENLAHLIRIATEQSLNQKTPLIC
ncbi:MAG: LuxR C-terminal-related transcriptional regulator [Coriobacteriia bacterium]|nr:LuxR C-terminal-related transcriptional regulator [Coriobacteriia bacterium]